MRKTTTLIAAALIAVSAPLLTACTSDNAEPTGTTEHGSTAEAAPTTEVTIADGWAKSAAADGMTGVFGTLENHTDADLTIESVESDAAGMVELHEVVDGVMRKIEGDVVIPAGGSFELAPGANHIMLMALTRDLLAGDEVALTLQLSDGSSSELTVLVKDYSGANENYAGGEDHDMGSEHGAEHTESE